MKLGFLRRVIPLLVLFCAIHAKSTHVRTKRTAGLAGFADPYALSDALGAIERERRRLQKDELIQEQLLVPSAGGYFLPELDELQTEDPESLRELLQYEETKNDPYRLMSEYRSRERYPAFTDFSGEDFPSAYSGYESGPYKPQKRTPYHPQRVTPTLEELEQIFSSANVPMKRTVPVKRRHFSTQNTDDDESISDLNKSTEDDVEDEDSDDTSAKTVTDDKAELARKMTSLLEAAEKLQKDDEGSSTEKEEDETESAVETPAGLTDAQLDDIFSASNTAGEDIEEQDTDDFEGDSTEEDDDSSNADEARPDAVEKLIDEYVSESKSKRMAKRDNRGPDISNLLEQIVDLKDKLSRVQLLRILEDRENSYLANALEYGTINQIEDKPTYLETEFENIEKATEIEAIMQLLSAQERDTDEYNEAQSLLNEYLDIGDDDDEIDDEADDMQEKRGEPDTAPGQATAVDEWYNSPVQDSVSSDSDDAVLTPMDVRNIESLLQRGDEEPIDVTYPSDEAEDSDELQEEIDTEEQTSEDKGALLKQLLAGLSPDEMQDLVEYYTEQKQAEEEEEEEEEVEQEAEAELGICPAVFELSHNCQFAEEFGIPIDDEARSLCVRHEMCYTCGAELGLPKQGCDDGFEGTVVQACGGDNLCLGKAMFFLKLMRRVHQYRPYSPGPCSQSCVEGFITGV